MCVCLFVCLPISRFHLEVLESRSDPGLGFGRGVQQDSGLLSHYFLKGSGVGGGKATSAEICALGVGGARGNTAGAAYLKPGMLQNSSIPSCLKPGHPPPPTHGPERFLQ